MSNQNERIRTTIVGCGNGLGFHVDGAALWRTRDDGARWFELTWPALGALKGIAFDVGRHRLWAAFADADVATLYCSDDDGDNWTVSEDGFNVLQPAIP